MRTPLHSPLLLVFVILSGFFCIAYPIAVIGVAFDVRPSFSLAWAPSALLYLEGTLLIIAAMLLYDHLRALLAALMVIVLSYLVEAVGVHTGLPFGTYYYTSMLFPMLTGGVPLPVMFAWVLIVFSAYGCCEGKTGMSRALMGATLAMLLDLAIEPVAAHVVYYWQWQNPGSISFYGVPLMNFAAWFVLAFALLLLTQMLLEGNKPQIFPLIEKQPVKHMRNEAALNFYFLPGLAPNLLFSASLFMFGLVDLTHGYYVAAAFAALGGLLLFLLTSSDKHHPALRDIPN